MYLSALLIANSAFWSAISHLYENHKHGMGLKEHSRNFSYFLNRMDVVSAIVLFVHIFLFLSNAFLRGNNLTENFGLVLTTICTHNQSKVLFTLLSFCCNIVSEEITTGEETRTWFILFHGIWHITIFLVLDLWIKDPLGKEDIVLIESLAPRKWNGE